MDDLLNLTGATIQSLLAPELQPAVSRAPPPAPGAFLYTVWLCPTFFKSTATSYLTSNTSSARRY